jgi:hypothetical protein
MSRKTQLTKFDISEQIDLMNAHDQDDFTMKQREFLTILANGVPRLEARRSADISFRTLETWESKGGRFRELEKYIIENSEAVHHQMLEEYIASITEVARKVLRSIINKGLRWDELNNHDKHYVWEAIKLIGGRSPKKPPERAYEDDVMDQYKTERQKHEVGED